MAKDDIRAVTRRILDGFLQEHGYELYHVEFLREGPDRFLRVYIDKASGAEDYVSTEDCETVSRYLSEKLDETDPVEQNYYLEVSSPGLDRMLVTPEHYRRYLGHSVDLKLYGAIDGAKEWTGILQDYDGETLSLQDEEGTSRIFPLKDVVRTRLTVII